jgi:hypothetical protein
LGCTSERWEEGVEVLVVVELGGWLVTHPHTGASLPRPSSRGSGGMEWESPDSPSKTQVYAVLPAVEAT